MLLVVVCCLLLLLVLLFCKSVSSIILGFFRERERESVMAWTWVGMWGWVG